MLNKHPQVLGDKLMLSKPGTGGATSVRNWHSIAGSLLTCCDPQIPLSCILLHLPKAPLPQPHHHVGTVVEWRKTRRKAKIILRCLEFFFKFWICFRPKHIFSYTLWFVGSAYYKFSLSWYNYTSQFSEITCPIKIVLKVSRFLTTHAPGLASLSPLPKHLLLFPRIRSSPLCPIALMQTPLLVFILLAGVSGSFCVDWVL